MTLWTSPDANKCVFLDRDGVLNRERGDYTYRVEDFEILEGVPESLKALKQAGFLLVVITNQAGISRGLYTHSQMEACHRFLRQACNDLIDEIYYCPYHPSVTASLCRKPDSMMFEKAIARFRIDPAKSWMVGDSGRDLIPAKKLGIKTVQVGNKAPSDLADYRVEHLADALRYIC